MVQVTERRERRVNGPDKPRTDSRAKLFLVKPGMNVAAPKSRGVRVEMLTKQAEEPKAVSNVIQMPSRTAAKRKDLRFSAAAAMAPMVWLGHAFLSLIRVR
jgi:hypothetical protein